MSAGHTIPDYCLKACTAFSRHAVCSRPALLAVFKYCTKWSCFLFNASLTEVVHHARLSCSKQSLNSIVFIWFIDGKVFALFTE